VSTSGISTWGISTNVVGYNAAIASTGPGGAIVTTAKQTSRSANMCSGGLEGSQLFTYVFNGSTSSVQESSEYNVIFSVPALQMTYTTPTSQATTSASPGSTVSGLATTTNTPLASHSPHTLSTGAKAGISIGVVVGVLTLLVAFFLLWRRYSRKKQQATDPAAWDKAELPGQHIDKSRVLSEVDGEQILEMDAPSKAVEAPTIASPVEMAA
jgi:hypothetical protein